MIPDALRNEKYQEKNIINANSKRQKTGLRSLSINVFGDFLYNENLNCHLHEHEKISADDIGTIKDMKKKVKIPELIEFHMKTLSTPEKPRIKKSHKKNSLDAKKTELDSKFRNPYSGISKSDVAALLISDESTPHLYISYKERIEGMLLLNY